MWQQSRDFWHNLTYFKQLLKYKEQLYHQSNTFQHVALTRVIGLLLYVPSRISVNLCNPSYIRFTNLP